MVGLGICLTLWAGRRAHERSLHEWYQYRPFFLVLRDLKSGDWEMIFHASTQMLRWLEAGGLSPSQKARVVSVVLAQMKANPLSRGVWTGPAAFVPDARGCFLGKMLLADELDERSTREFLMIPNVFELTIMARPKGFWGLGIRSPLSQIPAKRRLLLRVQVELSERDGQQVLPRQVMASYMLTVHRVDGQPIDDSLHTTHQGDVFPPAFESMVFRVRTAWYLTGLGEASKLPEWATSPVAMADFRRIMAAKSTLFLAEFEDAVKVDDSNGWDAVVPQTPATGPATRPAAGPRDRPL
ncbi:MAG: hypothetical protein NTW19_13445 [Planctomycetota bacterium]|nr:hypothetical protein [Planctomycetota bacterium]